MAKISIKLKKQFNQTKIRSKEDKKISYSVIEEHFYKPILQAIENEGYNDDGVLIADVDGLQVMADILESILYEKRNYNGEILGSIEIIENAVVTQDLEEDSLDEDVSDGDDKEEVEDNEDEEDVEDEDEDEDEDIEECLDEYKECDTYLDNISEDSMDDY